jgi:RimJ/RimL family protein N-acetyltransferase
VVEADLAIFYEHQLDPEATRMADFPARSSDEFLAHWRKVLHDELIAKQTIVDGGQVAGNIMCFEHAGKREVGYWLGRQHWGRGLATRALVEFLGRLSERPLYAYAVQHNHASIRVLQKCGFTIYAEDAGGAMLILER